MHYAVNFSYSLRFTSITHSIPQMSAPVRSLKRLRHSSDRHDCYLTSPLLKLPCECRKHFRLYTPFFFWHADTLISQTDKRHPVKIISEVWSYSALRYVTKNISRRPKQCLLKLIFVLVGLLCSHTSMKWWESNFSPMTTILGDF